MSASHNADAAMLGPIDELKKSISQKGDESPSLKKTGETMLTLGKLLQGELSFATAEERDSALNALQTLNTSLAGRDDTEQYFIIVLLKAIAAAAITAGVSTGVGIEVDKALKKGIKKSWRKSG
ncbi:uncharacterized protein LOC144123194 [Amblyomma americanum]